MMDSKDEKRKATKYQIKYRKYIKNQRRSKVTLIMFDG